MSEELQNLLARMTSDQRKHLADVMSNYLEQFVDDDLENLRVTERFIFGFAFLIRYIDRKPTSDITLDLLPTLQQIRTL